MRTTAFGSEAPGIGSVVPDGDGTPGVKRGDGGEGGELVRVFLGHLDTPGWPAEELVGLLSTEERERAARFHHRRDRERSRVSWGLVRIVLGAVVGRAPDTLVFDRSEFGKPTLDDGPSFNISHSGSRLAIAVAPVGRLGVDLEVRRPLPEALSLADQFFSQEEIAAVHHAPADTRELLFLRIWTRKEALVKAVGRGLSIPLDSFSVPAGDVDHAIRLRLDPFGDFEGDWAICPLSLEGAAEGAVAWDRSGFQVECAEMPCR